MKIDINDPRITAFALGELQGRDAIEIARAVHSDARIRSAVDEVRETSFVLMESLGGGAAEMLTASQRKTILSAGGGCVITDIASARVPVWKKPWVAGIGAAAAVALTLYMVADRSGHSRAGGQGVAGADIESFPAPITENSIETLSPNTSLRGNEWQKVSADTRLNVPLRSGFGSWARFVENVEKKQTLPPISSIRMDAFINHFQYKIPGSLKGTGNEEGFAADMEICVHPWNPNSLLLAVHIKTQTSADLLKGNVGLKVDSERVQRVRLLGYDRSHRTKPTMGDFVDSPSVSSSRSNYVFYELESMPSEQGDGPLATLVFGDESGLAMTQPVRWIDASADMRFASVIAATGMIVNRDRSLGDLDAQKLRSLVDMIESQDEADLTSERRDALKSIKKAIELLGKTP